MTAAGGYWVTATNTAGCANTSAPLIVTVNPAASAAFSWARFAGFPDFEPFLPLALFDPPEPPGAPPMRIPGVTPADLQILWVHARTK